ncbi:unnamed protein product, partial [Prorocentrum cordatum]
AQNSARGVGACARAGPSAGRAGQAKERAAGWAEPRMQLPEPVANGAAGRGDLPSRCAECGTTLADALVLTCGHDLCLNCAARALSRTRSQSGRAIRCVLCSSVTELVEDAVSALTARGASRGPSASVAATTPGASAATALQTAAALQSAATAASNAAFDRIDANHDGVITRDELSRAMSGGAPPMGATSVRGACGGCGPGLLSQARGQAAPPQPQQAAWQLGGRR